MSLNGAASAATTHRDTKKISLICLERDFVGVTGFEPATPWSQTRCATNCATPRITVSFFVEGPSTTPSNHASKPFSSCRGDRIRTCDPLVPNQMRYQLRYTPKLVSILNHPQMVSDTGVQRYFFFLTLQCFCNKIIKKISGRLPYRRFRWHQMLKYVIYVCLRQCMNIHNLNTCCYLVSHMVSSSSRHRWQQWQHC